MPSDKKSPKQQSQKSSSADAVGFEAKEVDLNAELEPEELPISLLSDEVALQSAQLLELVGSEGSIIFYPKVHDFEVGDVLYLRERIYGAAEEKEKDVKDQENGLIVRVISKGTARYPQADSKALFRLLTASYAREIKRSHNEPKEIIDEFLVADFIVRASIHRSQWKDTEGKVVTRNIDIFPIKPKFLLDNVVCSEKDLNLFLGAYGKEENAENVEVYAGGFEKINLVTGMKGGGKSHIVKGIIHLQRNLGMPSVVFDINREYSTLPESQTFIPTRDLKFRLDKLPINSLFEVFTKLSLFGTSPATENAVRANLPRIITQRIEDGKIPDLQFLLNQATTVVGNDQRMLDAYRRAVNNLINYELFCTEEEAQNEDEAIGRREAPETAMSLRSVFYMMTDPGKQSLSYLQTNAKVVVFDIGGLVPRIQEVVVRLVIDQLKEICHLQSDYLKDSKVEIPIYPSIFFEEAHMYMDSDYINELIPLIRHLGMNLFFVTNTPGALPDSVFRLVDNLIMTRMINKKDIDKVVDCGLADKRTIEGFARDLPEYHNLFLSAKNGATTNFPLVFKVRDFTAEPPEGENLPKSGVTRSMWAVIKQMVVNS